MIQGYALCISEIREAKKSDDKVSEEWMYCWRRGKTIFSDEIEIDFHLRNRKFIIFFVFSIFALDFGLCWAEVRSFFNLKINNP